MTAERAALHHWQVPGILRTSLAAPRRDLGRQSRRNEFLHVPVQKLSAHLALCYQKEKRIAQSTENHVYQHEQLWPHTAEFLHLR